MFNQIEQDIVKCGETLITDEFSEEYSVALNTFNKFDYQRRNGKTTMIVG